MKKCLNIGLIIFVTDVGGTGGGGTGPDAPIDGGISLLLGAGIAYGTKRTYSRKKKINGK